MSESIPIHEYLEIVREEVEGLLEKVVEDARAAATTDNTDAARRFAIQARESAGAAIGKFLRARRDAYESIGKGTDTLIDDALLDIEATMLAAITHAKDADNASIRLMRVKGVRN